ncbi:DUF3344 domain-containing protein [Methanobrevibacter sp.]
MIVLSIGAVSAEDVDDAIASSEEDIALADPEPVSGTVSGGVDVVAENPGNTSGELNYDIPADAKTIKSADVYVNVYGGSAQSTHGANANVTITTANNDTKYNESLWIADGSTDGTIYPVNDHTTKCYSDYMIHYDITSLLAGLNGTKISIKVDTFKMDDKSFDGRIKLIGLVLAYDDGDEDKIDYLIDDSQIWANSNKTINFNASSFNEDVFKATLTNIALSSSDATYKINDNFTEAINHTSGRFYYQFNQWDVTDFLKESQKIELYVTPGIGYSGPSYKGVLSVLTSISGNYSTGITNFKVTDNSKDIVYPGFDNKFTFTVNASKAGKYTVNLLVDGNVVNTTSFDLISGDNTLNIVDPTIREVKDSSKFTGNSSAVYETVNYTLQVLFDGKSVGESSYQATILYNGYLGKDTYNDVSLAPFYISTITGNIVILTNGTYASSNNKYALTNFNVTLTEKDTLVKAFLYVTYAYGGSNDNINMFNVTLNGNKLTPGYFARDASNLKANSGSGVIVYDATEYVINGVNVLDLNKTSSAGVYPTTLIYMYDTEGSKLVKEVYISNGADLIGSYGGLANPIQVDNEINVDSNDVKDATAYIFANGAVDGRGTVVINGESEAHPWNGDSQSTDLYTKDITGKVKDSNNISVIFTGTSGSFTALQQIIVLTKNAPVDTAITAPAVTVTYNSNAKNLVITLKDANGNVISDAKLTVNFNGKNTPLTTNAKGQAVLAISTKLVPKTYNAVITYDGDATHVKSTATAKVTVKKATVKLTAKKKTFKAKKKSKKYSVILKDNKGKAMKKVKLTLKVKGKTYKATTNAKGKATFNLKKLTKKGTHKAKITYKGDKYFNKLVKTVKIKVKK